MCRANYSIWGPLFGDELFQGEQFNLGSPIWGQAIAGRTIRFGSWGPRFGAMWDPNLIL
jgi:hypothetical protein